MRLACGKNWWMKAPPIRSAPVPEIDWVTAIRPSLNGLESGPYASLAARAVKLGSPAMGAYSLFSLASTILRSASRTEGSTQGCRVRRGAPGAAHFAVLIAIRADAEVDLVFKAVGFVGLRDACAVSLARERCRPDRGSRPAGLGGPRSRGSTSRVACEIGREARVRRAVLKRDARAMRATGARSRSSATSFPLRLSLARCET